MLSRVGDFPSLSWANHVSLCDVFVKYSTMFMNNRRHPGYISYPFLWLSLINLAILFPKNIFEKKYMDLIIMDIE